MKKILILEDDRLLAQTLKGGLTTSHTQASLSHTLDDFYTKIAQEQFALCVMDRIIGYQDSLEAIGEVREIQPQAKILFLSKKAAVADRIRGLEAGADDYLAKPFSLAELRLRVKSLLSLYRAEGEIEGVSIGTLTFFPLQGMLNTPEGKISLRRRETEILACLVRAAGAVVSREQLIRMLWPESFEPNSSTVDVYIRRLRQRLGQYQSILQTKRGFGYRLVPFERKV